MTTTTPTLTHIRGRGSRYLHPRLDRPGRAGYASAEAALAYRGRVYLLEMGPGWWVLRTESGQEIGRRTEGTWDEAPPLQWFVARGEQLAARDVRWCLGV